MKLQLEAMRITLTQVHSSQLRLVKAELESEHMETRGALEAQHRAELDRVHAEIAHLQIQQSRPKSGW